MADPIMDGVEIDYNEDYQRYHLTVPNRNERIVVERVSTGSTLFRIRYESGKQVKGLESFYTGKTEAFRAFRSWLVANGPSKAVLRDEWFGEAKPPELQRKKRIRKVNEPIPSSDGG